MNNTRQRNLLLLGALCLLLVVIVVISFFFFEGAVNRAKLLNSGDDFVRFIDVGQGDCVLIYSNGHAAMIDFGDNVDDGYGLLGDLRKYGIRELDCMIVTHYDSDHIGGADTVLSELKVKNLILPERRDDESTALSELDRAVIRRSPATYPATVGTVINIGEFELTIVAYYSDEESSNSRSIVVMAKIGDKKFLFTGDADKKVEERMMEDGLLLDCDVFKAAHHGSRYSNTLEFLNYITPDYTVISCGRNNSYGHPNGEVLENLREVDSEVYRTDINGDVTFYVDDGKLTFVTEYAS